MFLTFKNSINIPNYVLVFYFRNKNIIVLKFRNKIKFLFICFILRVLVFKNKIFLFNYFLLNKAFIIYKKKAILLKKLLFSFLKQFLVEIQIKIYSKLKFIGVGYKFFTTDYNKILLFKLGYSHSIFLKLNLFFFNLKNTKLFIVSNFYKKIIKICSIVQSFKYPDVYKGKGILYSADKIKLKQGKKFK